MRRLCVTFVLLIMIMGTVLPALAHSGRTDGKGGHYDHSTGEYHYHHGHPAHQHPNGVCPYSFDDKTGQSSGGTSGGKSGNRSNGENGRYILYGLVGSGLVVWLLVRIFRKKKKCLKPSPTKKNSSTASRKNHAKSVFIICLSFFGASTISMFFDETPVSRIVFASSLCIGFFSFLSIGHPKPHVSTQQSEKPNNKLIEPQPTTSLAPPSDHRLIQMLPVKSSNIHSIGYMAGLLVVRFQNSGTYLYRDVPKELVAELLNASSCGRFFNAYIRDRYVCEYIGGRCQYVKNEQGEFIDISQSESS